MVSDVMYESVVLPGDGYIPPECFRPVVVAVKEFDARAWLLTPCVQWYCAKRTETAA